MDSGQRKALRVLIADDDQEMRAYVRDILAKRGWRSVLASSGDELLARLADDEPYDLVVSDLRMPSPNGLAVASMIRTAGLGTPFLLVTAFPDDEFARAMGALPSTALLGKPFTPAQLVAAADTLTSSSLG